MAAPRSYGRLRKSDPLGIADAPRTGRLVAAAYVRLSLKTTRSTSPKRQLDGCRKAADMQNADIPADLIFNEIDVSAFSCPLDKREKLTKLRARLCEIDMLIVFKLDRLIRSARDFAILCDELARYNVLLVSVVEGVIDTRGMGKALAQIAAIFAELEAETISFRTSSSIAHLRKVGRWKGGTTPFGFEAIKNPNGSGFVLAEHPEEGELVRELARRVLAGETWADIRRDWNARAIPTRMGAQFWTGKVLKQILRNPVCIGQQVHHAEVMLDESGMPWAPHPALLDQATWDAVQAKLDSATDHAGWSKREGGALLTSVMRCDLCAKPLKSHHEPSRGTMSYRCSMPEYGGICPGVSINASYIEDYLTTTFLDRLGDSPYVQKVRHGAPQDFGQEIAAVRTAMRRLLAERYDPNRPFTGEEGDDLYNEQAEALKRHLDALRARQAAQPKSRLEWVSTGRTIREEWEASDTAERRALLLTFFDDVSVARGVRGRRTFDPTRVQVRTAEDVGRDTEDMVRLVGAGEPLRPRKRGRHEDAGEPLAA